MAQGLINNGVNVTKSFSPNEYELLADYTVSGSAITSYTFSGLKLNEDEEVVLASSIVNSASGSDYAIFVNANYTQTNYYRQYLFGNGTAISSGKVNDASTSYVNGSQNGFVITNIKLTNNGYVVFQSNTNYGLNTIALFNAHTTTTFTLSQITSLTITSFIASAIGIGSRFQLYKVKGQVQQTWATT